MYSVSSIWMEYIFFKWGFSYDFHTFQPLYYTQNQRKAWDVIFLWKDRMIGEFSILLITQTKKEKISQEVYMGYIRIFKVLSKWEFDEKNQNSFLTVKKSKIHILLDIKISLKIWNCVYILITLRDFFLRLEYPFLFYIWFFFFRSEWIENVLLYSKGIIKMELLYMHWKVRIWLEYNSILKNITILIECFFYYIVYKNQFSIFNLYEKYFLFGEYRKKEIF